MKHFKAIFSFTLALLLSFSVISAENKEKETYVYSTYFQCDVEQEEAVDNLVKKSYAPIYNAAVKDGTISGWGWFEHYAGGQWRRLMYHAAPSISQLLKSQSSIGKKIEKKTGQRYDHRSPA